MNHLSNLLEVIRDYLNFKETKQMSIYGGSMAPILKNNQKVDIVLPVFPLKKGGCYVFLKGSALLIHRLVAVRGKNVIFIGDNNRYPEVISKNRIIGELKYQPAEALVKIICFVNYIFIRLIYLIPNISRLRIAFIRIASKLYTGVSNYGK